MNIELLIGNRAISYDRGFAVYKADAIGVGFWLELGLLRCGGGMGWETE